MFAKALPMSMDFGGEFLARPSRKWFRSDLETPEGKCPSEDVTLVSRVTSSEGRWMEKGFGRPERTSTGDLHTRVRVIGHGPWNLDPTQTDPPACGQVPTGGLKVAGGRATPVFREMKRSIKGPIYTGAKYILGPFLYLFE
jgi:hypothetical protein